MYPFLSISVRFGIGATIRIGQEIQCLPYAGFFIQRLCRKILTYLKVYLEAKLFVKQGLLVIDRPTVAGMS